MTIKSKFKNGNEIAEGIMTGLAELQNYVNARNTLIERITGYLEEQNQEYKQATGRDLSETDYYDVVKSDETINMLSETIGLSEKELIGLIKAKREMQITNKPEPIV